MVIGAVVDGVFSVFDGIEYIVKDVTRSETVAKVVKYSVMAFCALTVYNAVRPLTGFEIAQKQLKQKDIDSLIESVDKKFRPLLFQAEKQFSSVWVSDVTYSHDGGRKGLQKIRIVVDKFGLDRDPGVATDPFVHQQRTRSLIKGCIISEKFDDSLVDKVRSLAGLCGMGQGLFIKSTPSSFNWYIDRAFAQFSFRQYKTF
jgi:hypothetical protein